MRSTNLLLPTDPEVVPGLVDFQAAVPRLRPAVR